MQKPAPKGVYAALACPHDNSSLYYTKDKKGFKCSKCGGVYTIKENILVLLVKLMN